MSTVTARLAERILATRWEDLPREVRDAAMSVLFDVVPVMAAGAAEPAARIVQDYIREMGGAPLCSIVGGGFRTDPPSAAFANGVAAHVLDYEPMWHPPTHPSSPVLPMALALAEWRGRNGRDVLTALVAGFETQTRLLLAVGDGTSPPSPPPLRGEGGDSPTTPTSRAGEGGDDGPWAAAGAGGESNTPPLRPDSRRRERVERLGASGEAISPPLRGEGSGVRSRADTVAQAATRGGLGGLHPPGIVGVMGAAAAAAWLLDLDVQQTCHALGIAASRVGGLMANVGTMTKSTHCGHAGRMGLEAALLAARGFTANEDILAAPTGFGEVYLRRADAPDPAADFGRPFRIHDPGVAIKKYPSQFGTQRAVDAALAIAREQRIHPEEIVEVTVVGPPMDYVDRPRPISGMDGKFSFQYVTAVALLDGQVGIDSFTDARRWASDVQALLPKVSYRANASIPSDFDGMWIRTRVRLTDGGELTGECRKPTGLWGIPLTTAERDFKARDCLTRVVPQASIDPILATLRRFAGCSPADIPRLLEMLGGER